jgi:DNA-binding phage protein
MNLEDQYVVPETPENLSCAEQNQLSRTCESLNKTLHGEGHPKISAGPAILAAKMEGLELIQLVRST